MRSMKKVLAATLAATMVMASAMTVCATTENAGSGSSSSSTTQETSTPATYAEANSQSAGASVKVGGVAVQTSIAGVYAAESLKGVAVTTPAADLAALSLTSGQKAAIIIYDTDQKKSTAAMVSVNAAIEALGGADLVSTLNIDLGAKQNGKWVTLSNGSVALKAGLPKTADTTKTYSVICVQPGGATTILEDQDTDPATVTFAVQAGLGTYAIVAK